MPDGALGKALWIAPILIAAAIPIPFSGSAHIIRYATLLWISILLAASWNFLAQSGQVSFGHAAFFGTGAYISALLVRDVALSPFASMPLASSAVALIGLGIGLICLRLTAWFLAMVTFGFPIIIQTLMAYQLSWLTGGWDGMPSFRLFSPAMPLYYVWEYYGICAIAGLGLLTLHLLSKSRVGLALRGIAQNELASRVSGIGSYGYKLLAFVVSTFFGGLAGALHAHYVGYISPEIYEVGTSFNPIIFCVIGGLGSIWGAALGAILVTLAWDLLRSLGLLWERFILFGILLILTIRFTPGGLISILKGWSSLPSSMRSERARRGS
ncbi:MAG: branched-chain amino acid ABC transporter permease [Candidatus Bathyarchaeia archaeon]